MAKAPRPAPLFVCLGLCASVYNACGDEPTAEPCRNPPTYTHDVRALTETTCLACHSDQLYGAARRGAPEALNYDSFEQIAPHRQAFANAFTSGTMPPPDSGLTVSPAARNIVASWRRCGFLP